MQIEKRRRRYFTIRVLPQDVRPVFGKTRRPASLKTEPVWIAKLRAAELDTQWSRQIAQAHETIGKGAPGDARELRTAQRVNSGSDSERDMLGAIFAGAAQRVPGPLAR
jgi:hypothetical protein